MKSKITALIFFVGASAMSFADSNSRPVFSDVYSPVVPAKVSLCGETIDSAGSGYADIVYFPKRGSILPALIVELKWNQSADGAIAQIKNRRYPEAVKEYGGEILLVGISYNREAPAGERKHQCRIERFTIPPAAF